jgi:hypothetical protein
MSVTNNQLCFPRRFILDPVTVSAATPTCNRRPLPIDFRPISFRDAGGEQILIIAVVVTIELVNKHFEAVNQENFLAVRVKNVRGP